MRQPSRIDWGTMIWTAAGAAVLAIFVAMMIGNVQSQQTTPPPTAELEISIEDMERIASMFAGEAKKIRDERMDALEARIERLEEEGQ